MDFSWLLNADFISAVIVIALLLLFVLKNKDKIFLHKIAFPFLYMILYRTEYGIKFMDKIATKYRELIKFLGYCFIGFGFYFMLFATYAIVRRMIEFFISPIQVDTEVALLLPGMNLPGFGVISFWHWILAIFILALIHEGAHGIVARAHNLKIKSSGFAFFSILVPILPAAFVEPDEKQLSKQPDHVQYSIYAAGPMTNILVALILLFALPWVNPMNVAQDNLAPFEDYFSDANGFSVNVQDGFPAELSGMEDETIIQSLNGDNVDDFIGFAEKIRSVKPGDSIILGTNKGDYKVKTIEHPDAPGVSYIGILGLRNERAVKDDHKIGGEVFYWFKGFLIWFYLLNLLVGIANLLPLGIVDGGRMLQVLFRRLFKNKKKAQQYWIFVSFLLLGLLLIGILAHYMKGWGLF